MNNQILTKNKMIRTCYTTFLILLTCSLFSQEGLRPLGSNINYFYENLHPKAVKANTDLSQEKSTAASISLPFVEDFYYSTTSNYPDLNKWEDSLVYINSGMGIAPLSIGVATFDGLNKNGYPYNPTLTNLTLSHAADKLTSRPINLRTSGSQTLMPSNNIAISFYYQARGRGDNPEQNDSLILDFFMPYATPDSITKPDTSWKRVWFAQGNLNSNTNDTVFKRAFVRITDTAYFHEGFKFRFRNYASVTGNFDHWHLDYIFLDKDRANEFVDTVRSDITFAGMPTSFLKNYSEMPLQQYESSEMAAKINNLIRNNSSAQLNMSYEYRVHDLYSNPIFPEYSGGFDNLNPFWPNTYTPPGHGYSKILAHVNPPVKDTFKITTSTSVEFPIKHYVFLNINSGTDILKENDTIMQYQRFRNFYAFDDGSAEAGYYVNEPGAKIAVKIKVNKRDTLRALRIYFEPVGLVSSISNTATTVYNFTMSVWGVDSNGEPTQYPIKHDSVTNHPVYLKDGFKQIPEFKFKYPMVLNPGVYFIGVKQASSILTFGFDMNYDHRTSLYFDTGKGWEQSKEFGSVMIQPVFGTFMAPVGMNEFDPEKTSFLIYPNPSSDQFTIRSSKIEHTSYQLYNVMGQLVKEDKIESAEQLVFTNTLHSGIYMLILKDKGHIVQQQKLIVQH